MFILVALAAGCVPLVLLEAGLRLTGVGANQPYHDPLVGFSRVAPLFELNETDGQYRTAHGHRVFFETQEFAQAKPENGYRIFCLGGSTVRGRPYTTQSAFARWLQLELSARDPQHVYEVVNCGGLSYASYRLTNILQEVLTYDPDLIIVATGHNEFLEDRTYGDIKQRSTARAWMEDRLQQLRMVRLVRDWATSTEDPPTDTEDTRSILSDEVDTFLDQGSGYASYHRDDAWAAGVAYHFDQSLRAMVRLCQAARVPAVFVLLGSNVRDCPPYKSEHRPNLTIDEERAWQAYVDEADSLAADEASQALTLLQSAVAIDPEQALLRFRVARLLDGLGRPEEAAEHYLAAKDFDVCPLRMRESLADALRAVAEQTQTPLVDARELIERQADDRLPGNDLYMDHVHPSLGSHQLIAAALVERLDRDRLISELLPWSSDDRRRVYRDHFQSLGEQHLIEGFERVSWLENWARRQRVMEETQPRDPLGHLRYGHRLWDFAEQEAAWEHYETALTMDPTTAPKLLARSERLFEQGRTAEAIRLLDRIWEANLGVPEDQLDSLRRRFKSADGL